MANINFDLTTSEHQFLEGCLRAANKLQELGAAGRSAGHQTRDAWDAAGNTLKGMLGTMGAITSATGLLAAGIRTVKGEIDHMHESARGAAEAQSATGRARASALPNRPADVNVAWLDKLVEETANQTGMKQVALWPVAGSLLSSKGSLTDQQFAASLWETARLGARADIDVPVFGGGIQDVMRNTGLRDPRKAGGWLLQVGTAARLTGLDKQITGASRSIAGAEQYGASAEQAAELFAFLTMYTSDIEGKRSASGAKNFLETLAAGTTAAGAILPKGRTGGGARRFQPLAGGDFPTRLTELQDWYASADTGLRNEFLAKLPGEVATKGGLLALIGRDPKALATYDSVKRQITAPSAAGTESLWNAMFNAIDQGKFASIGATRRAGQSVTDEINLHQTQAAELEAIREETGNAFSAAGAIGYLPAAYHKIAMWGGGASHIRSALGWAKGVYEGGPITVPAMEGSYTSEAPRDEVMVQQFQRLLDRLDAFEAKYLHGPNGQPPARVEVVGGTPNPYAHD